LNAALEVFSGTNFAQLQRLDYTSFQIPGVRYLKFTATVGSSYQLRVSGHWQGDFTAQLTASPAPVIVRQPDSCTVSPYGSTAFYVIAAGLPAPSFQWMFNGAALPGQTAPVLTVHNVQTNLAGNYSVIVSNSGGATQSADAVLTVTDTNPVPILTALPPTNATQVPFLLKGEPGRWYRFDATDDFVNWYGTVNYVWFGSATNMVSTFRVPRNNQERQFIRASLNVPTDVCIGHLKAMSGALNLYAIENKLLPNDGYSLDNLAPYSPGGTNPVCPQGGTYFAGSTITNNPVCSVEPYYGHHLPWQ
jgi:hypothetical protein